MLTSGLEDYLELIYTKIEDNQDVKAIDIANAFNVSRPSVSEALIRLADLDLIVYEGRKGIKITSKGVEEAKKVLDKHRILSGFFSEILGVSSDIADKNACKIEHVIDDELVKKIKEFSQYCVSMDVAEGFRGYNGK